MKIVEIGNLRETRAVLPFKPVYAEVRLVPANGAGENLYGKGVGR